jgi:hypothetical protein
VNAFPLLGQRVFNTPLAIHPAKAEVIMAAIGDRLGVTQVSRLNGRAVAGHEWAEDFEEEGPTPRRLRHRRRRCGHPDPRLARPAPRLASPLQRHDRL